MLQCVTCKHLAFWLTTCGVVLAACSSDAATSRGDVAERARIDFERIDRAVDAAIAGWNESDAGKATPIHGASVVIARKQDGALHEMGYGDFASDRLYLVASASKILSAGVIMHLQDQGQLDIETPIDTYLADWGQHKTGVTLAQLLSGSSGLPSFAEVATAGADPAKQAQYAAHQCELRSVGTLADCGKSIYQDELPENNRAPDETFRYGGSAWQLAGTIAEVVSGKRWGDLIRETYEACGVPSLGFTHQAGIPGASGLAYPTRFAGDAANAPATDNPLIEGGAYVTAPDYAKLLLMHMRGGKCGNDRVLSESAVVTMRTDRVTAYGGDPGTSEAAARGLFNGYGLGWWIAEDFIADPGAYGAFPVIHGDNDYGVVLLLEANSAAAGKIMSELHPLLLQTLTPE